MKLRHLSLRAVCLAGVLAVTSSAWAETIAVFSGTVTGKDPLQQGTLDRNGIVSEWASPKPFPGVVNSGTTYFYTTFVITEQMLAQTPFVQLIFNSTSPNTFIAAYAGAYDPTDPAATYLGDPGSSGNNGSNPLKFEVLVPLDTNLVLVVNNTGADGLGLGNRFVLTVDGYTDSEFDNPVPEPASLVLLGSGLLSLVGVVRWKIKTT